MQVTATAISEVLLIEPKVFGDERGFFFESFNQRVWQEKTGIERNFVQDNHSRSCRGVLRGLHYQYPSWQGKLVLAIEGEIYDVVVDIRRDSPTFGKWYGITLNAQTHEQLYVPPGFAHGFCVLSDTARVLYKCTNYYAPGQEYTLLWNDPDLGITWPVQNPILADKDAQGLRLQDAFIPG